MWLQVALIVEGRRPLIFLVPLTRLLCLQMLGKAVGDEVVLARFAPTAASVPELAHVLLEVGFWV